MAKRAALSVIRPAGSTSHETDPGTKLPPSKPRQPNWEERMPVVDGDPLTAVDAAYARSVAAEAWKRWVDELWKAGLLNRAHGDVLADAAICVGRIAQCERDISRNGIQYLSDRKTKVMNRAVTAASAYRQALKGYIALLGLAPGAKLKPQVRGPEGDGVWDD